MKITSSFRMLSLYSFTFVCQGKYKEKPAGKRRAASAVALSLYGIQGLVDLRI
jgi:hypothetical protein